MTPVYELSSPLQLPPEAASDDLGDENRRISVPINGTPLKVFNNDRATVPSKDQAQQSYDDEIWSKLPAWAKILEDLKRKAKRT